MRDQPADGPPRAPQESFEHTQHGVRRPDPYHWMSRLDGGVLSHLEAERTWYDTATEHLRPLVQRLRSEMTARVPATDSSVSWRHHGYSYYTVLPAEREYARLVRERDLAAPDAAPQVLLDVNELADQSGYVELGLSQVSPDDRRLAWSVDRDGDEVYELRFRDLDTGRDLEEVVPRSYYGGAWSADSAYFFYTVHDEAYRPHQVWRHALGSPPGDDLLVLEEADERFELNLRGSRSGGLVIVWAESRDTNEVWTIDAADPHGPARSVGGRRAGVEYHAEHLVRPDGSDELLVVTNDGATEFRLARCPVPRDGDQDATAWSAVRPEDPAERLERVDAFATHVVLTSRVAGHNRLRLLRWDDLGGPGVVVDPVSSPGSVALARNAEFDTDRVTVRDESYLEPPVWSEVDLDTGSRTERHRRLAPGHDPAGYVAEMMSFPAPDGTAVPASVLRHRDTPLDGSAPAVLYGYGAYEAVDDPAWDPALPSLLDRGVVYVHAHVRGGGEGGRRWWLDGRLAAKQNTFTDHAAVADGLDGLVDGGRLATRGLSAGGLLQGAVFSQRPERWRAVVAEVPFVDVVTTMFDPSIPLTITEWDEWGDPRRLADFTWMLAYSPYDNLPPAGGRPDLLVTGAVHDPRVMVFEPAKWVAALRESDPDWSPRCLFRVETGAGAHVGPSGRYAHLAYEAEIYAWVLDRLGLTDSSISNEYGG
jgi:oligopeptidase B